MSGTMSAAKSSGTLRRCSALLLLGALFAWPAGGLAVSPQGPSHAAAQPKAAGWETLELPPSWRRFLVTGRWDATPSSFRIIALSFLADGCVAAAEHEPARRDAARACVRRVLDLAEATRPPGAQGKGGAPASGAKTFDEGTVREGLWLSHWALILGAADRLGTCPSATEHAAVANALAVASSRAPHHHVPSYAHSPLRWPADQTVLFAALSRFDKAHDAHLTPQPWAAFKEEIAAHATDPETGLPWSELTGRGRGARLPRGCALTFQTRFVHEVDPDLAKTWWRATKDHYLVDLGLLVGMREWPAGHELPADIDSGPIVAHVGAAATVFGLIAAKVEGDSLLAARLGATMKAGTVLADRRASWHRLEHSLLADGIRYLAETL